MRILFVSDSPILYDQYISYLEIKGFEVVKVTDGNQGYDILQTQPVDLVVINLHKTSYNGWQLLYEIRDTDSGLTDLPVIILDESTPENALKAWSQKAELLPSDSLLPLTQVILKSTGTHPNQPQ